MHLRPAAKETLLAELDRIAEGAMDEHFSDRILDRAEGYYNLHLWSVPTLERGRLTTHVQGTRRYTVTATLDANGLTLDCTCPYAQDYGNCKHLAAFLWLLTDEWRDYLLRLLEIGPAPDADKALDKYLAKLSKKELRELVSRFAPPEFSREIALRDAPPDVAEAALATVLRQLNGLLDSSEQYEGPAYYEEQLERLLDQLRSFLLTHAQALLPHLRDIWTDINARTENGELYDHYSDGPFDTGAVQTFSADWVYVHPDPKAALEELIAIYEEVDAFGTFTGFVPILLARAPDEDTLRRLWPVFARTQVRGLILRQEEYGIYELLRPVLDADGMLEVLEGFSRTYDARLEEAYCRLLEARGKAAAALREVRFYLRETRYAHALDQLRCYHLELLERARGHREATEQALAYLVSDDGASLSLYRYALDHWSDGEHNRFEEALRQRHPPLLFRFFHEAGRPAEALSVLRDHPSLTETHEQTVYDLFRDYPRQEPAATAEFARTRLRVHLEPAHERAYKRVVEMVRLLKEVLPTGEFAEVVHDIRTRYRRRSKLLGMLSGG